MFISLSMQFNLSGLFLGMMFALSGTIYALSAPAWGWLCDRKVRVLDDVLMNYSTKFHL